MVGTTASSYFLHSSTRAHLPINSSLPHTVPSAIIDCLDFVRQSVAVNTQKQAAEKSLSTDMICLLHGGRMMYAVS